MWLRMRVRVRVAWGGEQNFFSTVQALARGRPHDQLAMSGAALAAPERALYDKYAHASFRGRVYVCM
jgi:hypothetical protein